MAETLRTLRLVHLTLIGLSAAILTLALTEMPDFDGALRELEDLRSLTSDFGASFFKACDEEANEQVRLHEPFNRDDRQPSSRDRVLQLMSAKSVQGSFDVAIEFAIRTYGFCAGPPIRGTLEEYEDFVLGFEFHFFYPDPGDGVITAILQRLDAWARKTPVEPPFRRLRALTQPTRPECRWLSTWNGFAS